MSRSALHQDLAARYLLGRHELFRLRLLLALDTAEAEPGGDQRADRTAERIGEQSGKQPCAKQIDDRDGRDGTRCHTYAQQRYQFQSLPRSMLVAEPRRSSKQKRTTLYPVIPKFS